MPTPPVASAALRLWAVVAIVFGTGLCVLALVAQAMQGDSAEGGLRFSHVLFG